MCSMPSGSLASRQFVIAPALAPDRANRPPTAISPSLAGLIVDMPDVLYDATLWRRSLANLVARLGIPLTYASFSQQWDSNYAADVHAGRREFSEALQSFLLAVGLSWAQVDEIESVARLHLQNLELDLRPLPGVVNTLRALCQSGLPLVAWADTARPARQLADLVARLGLAGQFVGILSSCDLEATLPAPQCYQAAIEALGWPPHRLAYLGHDAEHLAGAKACGLWTVAFSFEPSADADYYLGRIEDLLTLVRDSSPPRSSQRVDSALHDARFDTSRDACRLNAPNRPNER